MVAAGKDRPTALLENFFKHGRVWPCASQEELHILCLNTKNQVIHREMVFKGSLNASIVHSREVFKIIVTHSSANIIVCHQHPSGDPTPSQEDIETTQRLVQCGQLFGIGLLDHIIVGDSSFTSLKEKGYF